MSSYVPDPRPASDLRASYKADMSLFNTRGQRNLCFCLIIFLLIAPLVLDGYYVAKLILFGIYGIAALGLTVLVGMSGQISLGHGAFFGFGAFASAWLASSTSIPPFFCIPLAGLMTTAIGMLFGLPAARIKGLYLALATFAAQYILEDFFNRADWFTGGAYGALAETISVFGYMLDNDTAYFYLVLFWVVLCVFMVSNITRTRTGRALFALRDHHLSAEIMGIKLTQYRVIAFGISSFLAGIGGALFGHWLGFVSAEGFTILLSVQFLAMVIIGGVSSVSGAMLGTIFVLILPEVAEFIAGQLAGILPQLEQGKAQIQEISVGAAIVIFLIFEPNGLIHRFRLIRASWKLYPFSH